MGKNNKKKDFVDELSSMLSVKRVEQVKREAQKEIFKIRLSELRRKIGVRQEDIKTFSQSGISKLENRKDMKISTLIEYLQSIGMGVEIKAYLMHDKNKKSARVTLLKV